MTASPAYRIASIDILRGLVMIIMALDHTRDFFHITAMTADPLNPATTTVALFFTRWITHFCAPVFVFLSGLSAYLSSQKKPRKEASVFLAKRGLWLVLAEVTIVTFGLTFNPFFNFILLQVIWAIGCSMILLSLLMRISYRTVLIAGILLFFGHNAIDYAQLPTAGIGGVLWTTLLTARGAIVPLGGGHFLMILYAILPWTGVMLMGYSIGPWFAKEFPAEKRKRLLLMSGGLLILLFIALRLARGYGDPGAWVPGEYSFFSFLNTSKYPPSLQFCCMTLGPAMIILALMENIRSGWTRFVSVYGRVPFFYFVLHFYILHVLLAIVFFASGHTAAQIIDPNVPFAFRPVAFGYSLPVIYIIWITLVAFLYYPCKWFNHYKINRPYWWLKYI